MSEINFLNIIQVLVAIALIGFILIQRGPGATAGSSFGGGASGTVFGAKGSGSFLTKATALLATAFFIITMLIAIDASETYASTGEGAEQDLGVFGSLEDDADATPVMVPTGDDQQPANDAVTDDVIKAAGNDSENTTEEAIDSIQDSAAEAGDEIEAATEAVQETAEDMGDEIEEATESTDDSDGDGNN